MKCIIQSLDDLELFVDSHISRNLERKTFILLDGEMGSGKTQLVQTLGKLRNWSNVASPTFSIIHSYVDDQLKCEIHHLDLYRLKSLVDLESTGFWDLVHEANSIIILEWSQILPKEHIPKDWRVVEILLSKINENHREISLSCT